MAGTLAVAAFATAARGLLPEWLRRCRDRYPRLTLRVSEREPDQAITALQAGDLDLAVAQDWPDDPLPVPDGLTRRALCDDTLDVALPAEHPLARRAQITLNELTGEDWVSWPADELCHGWLARTLRQLGSAPRIAHTASEHSTQLALVAANMGAAVLPRLGREPLPAGARMIALHPAPCRRVFALWRSAATHRPALRAGLHELVATAEDTGQPT